MSSVLEPLAPSQLQATGSGALSRQPANAIPWKIAVPATLVCLPLLCWRIVLLRAAMPLEDFMTYWASGRLFLTGSDPYSSTAMLAVERSLGWHAAQPLVMLNPPWVLPLVALLGLMSFPAAHYAWLCISLAIEAISAVALWRYFGGEKKHQWVALALVATFLPAGAAEHLGQATPLMLAGLTAFLFALRHRRYFLGGVCLLTLGVKPHLLYLVLLAILLWAFQNKKWTLALGAFLSYATATLAAIAFNRNVPGYFHGTVRAAIDTSCGVGGVLRAAFGVQHTWLQFLPTVIGTAWFVFYWTKNRRAWTWEAHLPLLLLVSISSAPYFWAHDFIVAVPALIAFAVAISRTPADWFMASAFYLVAQKAVFSQAAVVSTAWMATVSLLWLVFYVAGTSSLAAFRKPAIEPQP